MIPVRGTNGKGFGAKRVLLKRVNTICIIAFKIKDLFGNFLAVIGTGLGVLDFGDNTKTDRTKKVVGLDVAIPDTADIYYSRTATDTTFEGPAVHMDTIFSLGGGIRIPAYG